jgi:signal peptidase I
MSDTQIDTAPKAPETPAPAKKPQSETREFMVFLVKLAIFVAILRSFIAAPFNIPSESMLPRLVDGDYLIVAKWPYGYSKYSLPFSVPLIPGRLFARQPESGDVVVFKKPPYQEVDYIKRVIGLPGDMIQMKEGQLFINGLPVPKKRISNFVIPVSPNTVCTMPQFEETASDGTQRCSYPRFTETLPNGKSYNVLDLGSRYNGDPDLVDPDNTPVYSVPAGHLFMMGDNRDNSEDSRIPIKDGGISIVPQENLVGRAAVTMFSTDGSASWIKPWTWFSAARWDRIGEGF